jgi:hypothetical protein
VFEQNVDLVSMVKRPCPKGVESPHRALMLKEGRPLNDYRVKTYKDVENDDQLF